MRDQLPEGMQPLPASEGGEVQKPGRSPILGALSGLLREIVETFLPALVIVLVINLFLAQATRVEGQSMEPSLHDNQRLIIEKVSYHLHPPQRGDIVVLRLPNRHSDPLIKRVIGLPGEVIDIQNGQVLINGEPLGEPYLRLHQDTLPVVVPLPFTVPEGHVFVLGDNRGSSNDSRTFSSVPISDIVGRAWFRYWPPSEIGFVR